MEINTRYFNTYNSSYPPLIPDERLAVCEIQAVILENIHKDYVPEPIKRKKKKTITPFILPLRLKPDGTKINGLAYLRELRKKSW